MHTAPVPIPFCVPTVVPVPLPSPAAQPLDLRMLCHDVGFSGVQPLSQGRYRRLAKVLEPRPVEISSDPLPVHACLDGTQALRLLVRRDHRDVCLAQVRAGAVDVSTREIVALEELLVGLCSYLDAPELLAACPDLPVVELDQHHPWEIPLAVSHWVGAARSALERRVLDACPSRDGSFLVLDGSLPADGARSDVVGAVKVATDTDWITDADQIPNQARWRSPALLLPAAGRGERDRLTALVRLRGCGPEQAWTFSLVRVECYADAGIDVLDAAAARVVAQAPSLRAADPRAEIQMDLMFRTESVLKARTPTFFAL